MTDEPTLPSDGLGAMLRQARERAGLDLSEIADRTHVRKAYLEALETEQLDELPEDVYARNFVRLYARAVEVDAEEAVDAFAALRQRQRGRSTGVFRTEAGSPSGTTSTRVPTRATSERAPRGRGRDARSSRPIGSALRGIVPLILTLVVAGVLVGTAVWGFNQLLFRTDQGGINATTPSSGTPEAGAPAVEPAAPEAGTSTDAGASGLAAPALPGGDALPDEVLLSIETEPAGAEVSVDAFPLPGRTPIDAIPVTAREARTLRVTRDGYLPYEASVDLSRDRDLRIVLEPVAADEGPTPAAGDLGGVVVDVREPAWLEAYQSTARGEGERLVYTTAQPGERYVFERPVYLHLGNAGGVDITVDGERIGPLGSGGAVTGQAFPAP